jgi:hypothetical protein
METPVAGWTWRAAVGSAVALLTLVVVACGGGEGEEAALLTPTTAPGVLDTVQAATATIANRPSPTAMPTETAAPPLTATPTPVPTGETGDMEGFRAFAQSIAQAAAGHDVAFFTGRVKGEPYTCTEGDVVGVGLGGAEPGLCKEIGQQVDLVPICHWQSECVYTLPGDLTAEIEGYFAQALPGESDSQGTGEVRLFAIGTTQPGLYEGRTTLRTAILTAIAPLTGRPDGAPVRTALGVDFEYVDSNWVIRGMLLAVFPEEALFEGFLSPDTGPYTQVERY